jgi:nicotinamidase-related amidase
MASKREDLHGNAPDKSPAALVLVDVINDLEFEGGERLLEHALPAARSIAALKRRAREAHIPVVYANDNFGRWRSDLNGVVQHCLEDGVRGQPVVELLRPEVDDYFVLKPKHSAFYATTLDLLLEYLEVKHLVLCGFSGDVCVLFSASDAYMRDYHLHVPRDCVASSNPRENARILAYMKRKLNADTAPSKEIDLAALRRRE